MISKLILKSKDADAVEKALKQLQNKALHVRKLGALVMLSGDIFSAISRSSNLPHSKTATDAINHLHETIGVELDAPVTYIEIGFTVELKRNFSYFPDTTDANKKSKIKFEIQQNEYRLIFRTARGGQGKTRVHYSLAVMYPGNIRHKRHCYTIEDFIKASAYKNLIKQWYTQFEKVAKRLRATTLTKSQMQLLDELESKISIQAILNAQT